MTRESSLTRSGPIITIARWLRRSHRSVESSWSGLSTESQMQHPPHSCGFIPNGSSELIRRRSTIWPPTMWNTSIISSERG